MTCRREHAETFDYQAGTGAALSSPGDGLYNSLTYFLFIPDGCQRSYAKANFMWNCQLSKAFLKRKQLLIRFKIYDILHQDISMIRTITATAIRDTDYNALGSYFMVHAILRLNMMGK